MSEKCADCKPRFSLVATDAPGDPAGLLTPAGPCPFCGQLPKISQAGPAPLGYKILSCKTPSCTVQPWVVGTSMPAVIKAWNTRAPAGA